MTRHPRILNDYHGDPGGAPVPFPTSSTLLLIQPKPRKSSVKIGYFKLKITKTYTSYVLSKNKLLSHEVDYFNNVVVVVIIIFRLLVKGFDNLPLLLKH